ncbi:MAG: DUF3558 domain-containing protein [Pseudonocardiaceae bacterium]
MAGIVVAGVLVAGVTLAGCGAGTAEDPAAQSVIPRVENPRDVRAIADRPCDLLSPQQAASFGLDRPPRQLPGVLGAVNCEWRSSRADVWVYISTFTDKPTLEEVYDRRGSLPYFELTEIGGYPATVSRENAGLPACDVDIKPAERQSVTVSYDSTAFNNNLQQGCVVGKQVARAVVMNLPPKG